MRPRLRVNPVLRRELLERWRGRRAAVALTIYLTVLGGALYAMYWVGEQALESEFRFGGGFDPVAAGPVLGRFLLEGLLFLVLLLVLFVVPGYAAAQLSGERERRTLPLLQVTMLRPEQIVLGKLGASTAWMTLLVVAAVPLGAAAFFLGGVSAGDLLRGALYILVVAVGVAGMALGVSALARRTTGAIVVTYGLVLALAVGSLFAAGVEAFVRSRDQDFSTPVSMYANPFFGLSDAVRAVGPSRGFEFGMFLPSPLGILSEALPRQGMMVEEIAEPAPLRPPLEVDGPFVEEPFMDVPPPLRADVARPGRSPVWLQVMGVYAALGLAGLALAAARLRRVDAGVRPGRRRRGRDGGAPAERAAPAPGGAADGVEAVAVAPDTDAGDQR